MRALPASAHKRMQAVKSEESRHGAPETSLAKARRPCRLCRRGRLGTPDFLRLLRAVFEALGLGQRLEPLQRVVLDLTDPLARDAEGAADLFQRARLRAREPEAKLDHLPLAIG